MTLTKDQEQAAFDACEDAMTEGLSHHDAARFRRGFIACAEWMQDENAKLLKVIEAEANYRLCMDVYLFDGDGAPYDDYGHSYCKLLKEIHQARTKAGIDQREAKEPLTPAPSEKGN